MSNVSELLKNRIEELHLTVDQVAEYCGVNRATVYRWLNGENDNMKRTNIASLAKLLKLDPAVIVGDLEEDDAKPLPAYNLIPKFQNVADAMTFLLKQQLIADFGGTDLSEMTDEQIINFAHEIAGMVNFAAYQKQNNRKE